MHVCLRDMLGGDARGWMWRWRWRCEARAPRAHGGCAVQASTSGGMQWNVSGSVRRSQPSSVAPTNLECCCHLASVLCARCPRCSVCCNCDWWRCAAHAPVPRSRENCASGSSWTPPTTCVVFLRTDCDAGEQGLGQVSRYGPAGVHMRPARTCTRQHHTPAAPTPIATPVPLQHCSSLRGPQ